MSRRKKHTSYWYCRAWQRPESQYLEGADSTWNQGISDDKCIVFHSITNIYVYVCVYIYIYTYHLYKGGLRMAGALVFGFGWGGFRFRSIVYFGLRASQRKMGKTYLQVFIPAKEHITFSTTSKQLWRIHTVWLDPCIAREGPNITSNPCANGTWEDVYFAHFCIPDTKTISGFWETSPFLRSMLLNFCSNPWKTSDPQACLI